MKFTKMHGCGNDYIYVNGFEVEVPDPAAVAVKVSDRRRGVGADGLILIKPSQVADALMDIYHADGSRAEMCGNGIRCVAKFLHDRGYVRGSKLSIETLSGRKEVTLHLENGRVVGASVTMGVPGMLHSGTLAVLDRELAYHALSLGNPHCVVFVDDVERFPVATYGPAIERHPLFPVGTNVAFAVPLDRRRLRQRTWERGSGETAACGTGATAAACVAIATRRCDSPVAVELNGGTLGIAWSGEGTPATMSGPAVEICEGDYHER